MVGMEEGEEEGDRPGLIGRPIMPGAGVTLVQGEELMVGSVVGAEFLIRLGDIPVTMAAAAEEVFMDPLAAEEWEEEGEEWEEVVVEWEEAVVVVEGIRSGIKEEQLLGLIILTNDHVSVILVMIG